MVPPESLQIGKFVDGVADVTYIPHGTTSRIGKIEMRSEEASPYYIAYYLKKIDDKHSQMTRIHGIANQTPEQAKQLIAREFDVVVLNMPGF